ncbi:CBS domain-containing protein CBSX1, chloroplastic-like [Panicum miliaceum]|uniref:CBS domain-containing protein CBSX1, chloroplastic-like n=1 Tax=Panicum miliaceum TaxID=4540 RepID=A0A3L6QLA1_PANMI|nr:CBS domain-containing protein CBSX1, chloroplastic-like [Panicum miliaceum]
MDATLLLSAVDATFAARRRPCTPARRPGRVVPGLRQASRRSVRARAAAAAAPAAMDGGPVPNLKALELLVQHRISGFPVVDDNWKLVGVVSDYDLLALDSMLGIPDSLEL